MDHLSKSSRVEKDVDRLGNVSCMQVVVVLDLLQVVVLQGHQEAEQGGGRDLEGAQEVSLLQDPEQKVEGQLQDEVNYLKVVQVSTLESLIKLLAVKTSKPQVLLRLPITSSNCTLECVSTP